MLKSIINFFSGKNTRALINGDPSWNNMTYPLIQSDDHGVSYLSGNYRHGANTESVLGIPSYWMGLQIISNRVGNLPFDLWQFNDDGSKSIAKNNPARKFAANSWDDWLHTQQAITTMTLNALRFGNSFAKIIRGNFAQPIKLAIIEPWRVTIYKTYNDDGSMTPSYRCDINGKIVEIPWEDMLHIRGITIGDALIGMSVIEKLNTALALNLKIYRYSETYFENGASPRVVVSYPLGKQITPEQMQDNILNWNKSFQGTSRAHGVAFMNNGASVETISDTASESQLLEEKQFSITDIANILGCPQSRLNGNITSSYNSLESDNKRYLEDCLDNWLCQFEIESSKLLTEQEKEDGNLKFCFDRSELDTPDYATLTTSSCLLRQWGGITTNELREKFGYDPLPDDQNLLMINSQMIEVKPTPPPVAPAPPQADDDDTDEAPENDATDDDVPDDDDSTEDSKQRATRAKTKPEDDDETDDDDDDETDDDDDDDEEEEPEPDDDDDDDEEEEPEPDDDDEPDDDEEQDEPEEHKKKRSVISATVERLMVRLSKSAHKTKDSGWFEAHKKVFRSSLPNSEKVIDEFFADLEQELTATIKEEHKKIIDFRVKNNKLLEVLA